MNPGLPGVKMNVEIKMLPEFHLAYARQVGPYGPELDAVWHKIYQWAEKANLVNPQMQGLAIYWDDPQTTPPDQCRCDACIVLPDNMRQPDISGSDIQMQTLPAAQYACYQQPTSMDDYTKIWQQLFMEWLPQSGYECVGATLELYVNPVKNLQQPNDPWDVCFCVPVKKK